MDSTRTLVFYGNSSHNYKIPPQKHLTPSLNTFLAYQLARFSPSYVSDRLKGETSSAWVVKVNWTDPILFPYFFS